MKDSMSIAHLIMEASLLVQLVMLLLLIASVISWFLVALKTIQFKRLKKVADNFEELFWAGGEMKIIYNHWNNKPEPEGIANIFIAGYREFARLFKKQNVDHSSFLDGVQRSMRVALSREIDILESHISFLATVGSTSPYVGLFGTVWGIMNSFRSLGSLQQVTIATVAPGIAEALIATAMGLFAAIPAVIAYNRFINTSERLTSRYEIFMEEFVSIVGRQDFVNKNI